MSNLRRFVGVWDHRATKLRALLTEPRYRRALRHRVAASVEHDRTSLRHDYRTVLDVGANRGQFALVAARRFPNATLVCFEPQSRPRAILERVLAGHPRLRVIDVAVAASSGASVLHVTQADDSSSLLPATQLQVDSFPGTAPAGEIPVATERLDVLVPPAALVPPVLLKIDVQGTELDVLVGASALLPAIDTVLVECSFVELYLGQSLASDVVSLLHESAFKLTSIVAPTIDSTGQILQADLLFERAPPA